MVARRAHNPEVVGSSPASATKQKPFPFREWLFKYLQTCGAVLASLRRGVVKPEACKVGRPIGPLITLIALIVLINLITLIALISLISLIILIPPGRAAANTASAACQNRAAGANTASHRLANAAPQAPIPQAQLANTSPFASLLLFYFLIYVYFCDKIYNYHISNALNLKNLGKN